MGIDKFSYNIKFKRILNVDLPLKCLGQQTNSTPLKREIPQGSSMAKDLSWSPLSWQAIAAVAFHRPKVQQLLWLWMWSNRQFSGTRRASDWNGPSKKSKHANLKTCRQKRSQGVYQKCEQWFVESESISHYFFKKGVGLFDLDC